jgi:hypothetical protein
MKWHWFWAGVWILGWEFTLGIVATTRLYVTATFGERLLDTFFVALLWPLILGMLIGGQR